MYMLEGLKVIAGSVILLFLIAFTKNQTCSPHRMLFM